MGSDRVAPPVSWEELVAATPKPIRDALPQVRWRLELLWRLDLPVRQISVGDLAWLLELPLWQLNGVRFQLSPRQVWNEPHRYPDHHRRVLAADLDYPIHLVDHHDRTVVLDGFHRLLKAAILEHEHIDAMMLSPADLTAVCARD